MTDRQAYVAPYRGWNYRPVAAGYRLQPAFYGPRYVIANPEYYRLPAARRGTSNGSAMAMICCW